MHLKDIKKLHHKKYREQFQCFLAEGEHLIDELEKATVRHPILKNSKVYVSGKHEHWSGPFAKTVVSKKQMSQLSETKSPQGIVARVPFLSSVTESRINILTAIPPPGRAVYLYEVQDPGNLGSILRSLAWFGNFRCLLSPGSVDPYHAKVIRASMGSIFHVPIEVDVPLDSLAQRFGKIACLDLDGECLTTPSFKDCDCYVFGNEARGIPRGSLASLNPQQFNIEGSGVIESLNLAAAVNMSVYELSREPSRAGFVESSA